MSLDYVRKIVSGKKARFQDEETAVDLDLVYVTDRIIIMGYPAVGVSALYRNRRRDVLKFINSRHGDKWWIWNLCPLYENAYSPESMSNRVSRYPFPDHHPPPLPLLPLAVREMTAWLEGDKERVAIIHCKAGKGRSGTLLCSYLLSLSELPPPPQLDRSYTRKELIKRMQESSTEKNVNPEEGADRQGWVVVGTGHEFEGVQVSPPTPTTSVDLGAPVGASGSDTPAQSETLQVESPHGLGRTVSITSSTTTVSRPSPPPSINIDVSSDPPFEAIAVGDEADYDQQGQQDRRDGRVDEVFKLHSSRRMKPSSAGRGVSIPSQRRWCRYIHLLFTHGAPPIYTQSSPSRIRVISVTLLLHPPTGWKKPLASLVVGGSGGSGLGKAWASVARYDDKYVEELKRRGGEGEGVSGAVTWGGVGGDGHFDTEKMFKSCGKLEAADLDEATRKTLGPDHEEFNVHHLVPKHVNGGDGSLVLDTAREFRLKLHLASMPLGWLWMIPAFHIPSTPEGQGSTKRFHTMTFPKSQVDFTLGPGAAVHKVIVRLEDVAEGQGGSSPAPLYTDDQEKKEGLNDEKAEKLMGDSEK